MSKRTSMRIPDDLHQWLAERAQRERRTVSNLVVTLLSEARERERVKADNASKSTEQDRG